MGPAHRLGRARRVDPRRVDVHADDAATVGATFTAYTAFGQLALEDRLRVSRCDWSDATSTGDCEVEKLGAILRGRAWFTVEPEGNGAVLLWLEDVTVRNVPEFVAPSSPGWVRWGFAPAWADSRSCSGSATRRHADVDPWESNHQIQAVDIDPLHP